MHFFIPFLTPLPSMFRDMCFDFGRLQLHSNLGGRDHSERNVWTSQEHIVMFLCNEVFAACHLHPTPTKGGSLNEDKTYSKFAPIPEIPHSGAVAHGSEPQFGLLLNENSAIHSFQNPYWIRCVSVEGASQNVLCEKFQLKNFGEALQYLVQAHWEDSSVPVLLWTYKSLTELSWTLEEVLIELWTGMHQILVAKITCHHLIQLVLCAYIICQSYA